jgi:E3 ubiquitin-protein ligase TRIP12
MVGNVRCRNYHDCVFVSPDVDAEELIPDGCLIDVTQENVDQYVKLVEERMICREQAEAFARGFGTALPWDATRVFSAEEFMQQLVGVEVPPFTLEGLLENVEVEHGYDKNSPQVRWFFTVLVEMEPHERQNFMLFLTGMRFSSESGLRGLTPPLSIARATFDASKKVDKLLPTVSTCAHYFKLPEYSSQEVLKERLLTAIEKGAMGFAFE